MTTDTPAAETPKKKARYQVRNWREYEAALVRRASLTVWVDEAVRAGWCEVDKTGRRGATRTYSEMAIQCALTLRAVYRLALRTADGLLGSILAVIAKLVFLGTLLAGIPIWSPPPFLPNWDALKLAWKGQAIRI